MTSAHTQRGILGQQPSPTEGSAKWSSKMHLCTVLLLLCIGTGYYLGNLFRIQIRIGFSLFNTYFPLCWKKRITELLSCFISSLIVKVIKYRFVAPGEGFYQDGCVSLIKYGPCFTRLLHLNDTYFDTLQCFFQKYLIQVFKFLSLL